MSFASTVAGLSPAAWWRLDESSGTTFADSSGNARDLTGMLGVTLGAASLLVGDADAAATFSAGGTGTNPPISAAASWLNVPNLTLFALFKTSTLANQSLIDRDDSVSNRQFQFRTNGSGNVQLIAFSGGSPITVTVSGNFCDGAVHVAAARINGTALTCVVDNVNTATGVLSGALDGAGTLPVAVGWSQFSTTTNRFPGVIDEPAVFTTALSDSDLTALWAAATGNTVTAVPRPRPRLHCQAVARSVM